MLIGLTQQIVICLCVAWNRVTNSVHQGSLWEGAVSQRLTEGESPGFFDAVSYEALVIDQRSLPQSASRPAPSQREPLVLPAKLQFIAMLSQSDMHITFFDITHNRNGLPGILGAFVLIFAGHSGIIDFGR